jgi:hypothetical protein
MISGESVFFCVKEFILCHYSAKLNQSLSKQRMEEMIFSAVKQEFTTSPDIYLDSGLKQTWKFLINVPKFLFEGNCLKKFEGRNHP